jgi:Rrf2 family protein
MKLSTRARYGMRLMLELAHKYGKGPVFLKEIAKQEAISEKYLSLIIIPLKAAGFVHSTRGAYGGYTLAKAPSEINLKEVVDILEGDTSLVDCVKDPSACSRVNTCASRDVWEIVSKKIAETLRSMTLETLAGMSREKAGKGIMYHI